MHPNGTPNARVSRKRGASDRNRPGKRAEPVKHTACSYLKPWLLRLLVPLGGHNDWLRPTSVRFADVARAIGLSHWVDDPGYAYKEEKALAQLRRAHREAEASCASAQIPHPLAENASRLAALLGLSAQEIQVIQFLVLLHQAPVLTEAAECIGGLADPNLYRALAVILGLPEVDIRSALSSQGRLARSGLVTVDRSVPMLLHYKFNLIGGFAERMMSALQDPIGIFRHSFRRAPPPTIALDDYEHLGPTLDVLLSHLRRALEHGRAGVNAYIYGPPGTGKSELTRVIAATLGAGLFEVSSEDQDGDPVEGEQRLRALQVAQGLLAGKPALLTFDESEDVFGGGESTFKHRSVAQTRKAWINRTLEENCVPCLWVSNSVVGVDPAILRRFDVALELGIPPRKQRLRIIRSACNGLIEETAIARLADASQVPPAVITRAANVLRAVRGDLPEEETMPALTRLIDGTLVAQGSRGLTSNGAESLPGFYDTAFINVEANLEEIASGIASTGSARLCLYGPPGTGKSAFGRWLADRINRPLHAKRVSDLVSPYVGMTERNLSRAFREAASERAVLLFDEVDSFLRDRQRAGRNWEVTEVNEMLTQMEGFDGVFVASTNLMDGLDRAALRRFDLKLCFNYLRPDQAWQIFERQALALGLPPPGKEIKASLTGLRDLTPGDFAAVARQSRFRPLQDCASMLNALTDECRVRDGTKRTAIGFI